MDRKEELVKRIQSRAAVEGRNNCGYETGTGQEGQVYRCIGSQAIAGDGRG
jgi:hypothetical protein